MASMSLRSKLSIFSGLICILYLYHVRHSSVVFQLGTAGPVSSDSDGLFGLTGSKRHPIEILIGQARARHADMVKRQSKTQEEAIREYKKRYSREPPPGFDHWYKAAVEADSPIIDEYDTAMAAFEPF